MIAVPATKIAEQMLHRGEPVSRIVDSTGLEPSEITGLARTLRLVPTSQDTVTCYCGWFYTGLKSDVADQVRYHSHGGTS